MTTASNIIAPWGVPIMDTSDVTNSFITTSATSTTTGSPNWLNIYENTTAGLTTNNASIISGEMEDNDSEVLRTIEYIGTVLCFYYVPIIVATGSIGNILSVCVFFKTKLRKLSSSFYLAALAVSDTCFLWGLFAQWLNFLDIQIYNRENFCQFFTFSSNLACFCSAWFVVAFTVERFIAVMYPLKRQTMCTVRRAKIVLISLTIVGCLHCAPFWISSTPVYSPKLEATICDIKTEYKDYITLLNYWDTVVVFVVPFTTIAVLNTFTGCTVWKFATVRRTLTMQKMKTQHLPLHGTISSHSSVCEEHASGSTAASAGVGASATLSSAAGIKTATTMFQQQQGMPAYQLTSASQKRQMSRPCANLSHTNGQHNHIVKGHHQPQHLHHQHHEHPDQHHHHHQHHSHQPEKPHMHSHPNRTSIVKKCTSVNSDCADIFSKTSRRRNVTNSSQLKVTKMLLIVSTVFVCLNLPSFIMRMITYLETQSSTNTKTTVVLQYIFQLLFITNFGINFVLYCVSGQNFRKAVLSMFRKTSIKQRDGTTQLTVSEYYRNSGGIGNISTRRRVMAQNCYKEMHELQHLK